MQEIIAADDRKVGLARLRGDDEDERYYRSYKQWAKKNGPTRGRLGSRRSLQAPRDWSYYPPEAHAIIPSGSRYGCRRVGCAALRGRVRYPPSRSYRPERSLGGFCRRS